MTRPIGEPSISKEQGSQDFGIRQLFRRPAPIVSPVVSMAQLSVNDVSIGAFAAFNFASINATFDASNYFDLTVGGDLQINDHGIFGLHFSFTDITVTSHKSGMLFMSADVTSGSNGLWTSALPSDDMFAAWAISIEDFNQNDIQAYGNPVATAYAAWTPDDTFPVVIQFAAEYTEDNVATGTTPDFRLTVVRLGAGDVVASS